MPPQLEISPDSPALAPVEPQVSPHSRMGGNVSCTDPLEKDQVPCLNATGALTPLGQLERNAEFMPQQQMRPDSLVEP